MYTVKEEREIEPKTMAQLVSSTLYERRLALFSSYSKLSCLWPNFRFGPYFIEPIIAGLTDPSKGSKPFIASADVIGCLNHAKDFAVVGTAQDRLLGVAESLWEPDLVGFQALTFMSFLYLSPLELITYSGT